MSNQEDYRDAMGFLNNHPELRSAMARSNIFSEIKNKLSPPLLIDGESIYFMFGDAGQVNEDELYYKALITGSTRSSSGDLYHDLFEELDPNLKQLISDEAKKKQS